MTIKRETALAIERQDARSVVQVEPRWRTHPDVWNASGRPAERTAMTSWSAPGLEKASEFSVEGSDLSGTLTYLRTSARGEFWVAGRHVFAGCIPPQTLIVGSSARAQRMVLRGPVSVFRVYLPQTLLHEAHERARERAMDTEIMLPDFEFLTDSTVERLVQALACAESGDQGFGRVLADSIGLAIASRLTANHLGFQDSQAGQGHASSMAAQPGHRLCGGLARHADRA